MSDQACAKCGRPRRDHSYNGACYGLCGEFVSPPEPTAPMTQSAQETALRWLCAQHASAQSLSRTVSGEGEHAEILRTIISMLRSMPLQDHRAPEGWALVPVKLTPRIACALEMCDGPELQRPEVLTQLVKDFEVVWDHVLVAALIAEEQTEAKS